MPGKKGTESERHLHTAPTPRMGGLAIYVGCCAAILLFVPMTDKVFYMLLGSVIIVVLGMLDDIYNLRPLVKLAVQLLAAGVAVHGGNVIRFFSNLSSLSDGSNWNLGTLSVPVTILWIVTITNAVNLIDGLDGLAAGVSTISSISMVIIALTYSNYAVAVITGALAGACIGFLPYNKPPAKIFMGDTGSTFIGYILAVASIQGLFKFYALISFVIPFLMLGLPIFDICYAFILRICHGENPMHADRKHVHYRLIDMGLSKKQTVAVLYAASALLGLTSVICTTNGLVRALTVLVAVGVVGLVSLKLYATRLRAMRGRMEESQDRVRPLPDGEAGSAPSEAPAREEPEADPADAPVREETDADPAQQG
ncbi:MAG: undecaprenyl/decaprenyl-phosphate alpha-N-acetylglucosaminyl 1-phosphate transferase [Clostridiales bacterium]|nr:undecaprenyl/decaprenyl-phosphate alpha-N-acetylglucosaminyl 1-phosphate transferase [Clostridiales bacterium]